MELDKSKESLQIILSKELEISSISDLWCELLQCSSSDVVGQHIDKILSDKTPLSNIEALIGKETEVEMVSFKGFALYLDLLIEHSESEFVIYGRDVTTFRKSQIQLHHLEEHAKIGYWERPYDGMTIWSDEIYNIFEVPITVNSPEFYQSISGSFLKDGSKLILSHLERIFISGGSFDVELEILTHNGNYKWVRITGKGVVHKGRVIRTEGIMQDVTTYRENLLRLFESQERLHFALSANDMGVWKLNIKTDELSWDANMSKIYGIPLERAPKSSHEFFQLILPEDVARLNAESLEGLKSPEQSIVSWFRVIVNGETRYIASRSGYAHSLGDDFYIGVNWDITDEKEAEETIKHQEAKIITSARLSSLGEMAGGIAHEINNPLSVILVRASQLKRRALKGDVENIELLEGLSQIEETCNRIVKIINGLRTISRDGAKDPFETVSLKHCIQEPITLINEKLKNKCVEIKLDLPEEDIFVNGRLVQLEQVMMNLLHNSYDAVLDLEAKDITIKVIKHHDIVEVRVRDSGTGVEEHLVDKIFAPFFTTKEIGKGTGIGLSISKSIVEEHGGDLAYYSDESNWYFSLTLPLTS